jgi:hypothetical protein
MHTESPRRSSVQNNLPRTHGVITAFKMVPPVGNRRQQRNNSWWSTGIWNSAPTRLTREESRSYHNTEFLIASTKVAQKIPLPNHKILLQLQKNIGSTKDCILEARGIITRAQLTSYLKAKLHPRIQFFFISQSPWKSGMSWCYNFGVWLFIH